MVSAHVTSTNDGDPQFPYRKSGKNSIIDSAVLATEDRVIMSKIDIQSKNIKDILLFKSNVFDEKELEDK